jgi:hypothetical protein
MSNVERVELTGALEGKYVSVNADALTIGVLEDLESGRLATVRAAVEALIAETDVPPLRDLTVPEFTSLIEGLRSVINPKKKG